MSRSPPADQETFEPQVSRRSARRIPFGRLLEAGLIRPGQRLHFQRDRSRVALVTADGRLIADGFAGSIHQVGRHLSDGAPCNGWDAWFYEEDLGELLSIDHLRERLRAQGLEDLRTGSGE